MFSLLTSTGKYESYLMKPIKICLGIKQVLQNTITYCVTAEQIFYLFLDQLKSIKFDLLLFLRKFESLL